MSNKMWFLLFFVLIIFVVSIVISYIRNTNFYYSGPETDHFKNGKFFNNFNTSDKRKKFYQVMLWYLKRQHKPWKNIDNQNFDIPPKKILSSNLRVSNIGHNSFLIQTEGLNILMDPVWSDRASPFSFVGPKRYSQPGIKFEDLPFIDVVWVSHNHYDHMDLKTLDRLWNKFKPRIITPLGNDTIIRSYNKNIECESYDWYDKVRISDSVSFNLKPAQHWSSRGLFDHNKALWSSLEIETSSGNILFLGDSGYGDGSIFSDYKNLKLAIIPMGAYKPKEIMEYSHISPEKFFQLHKDLLMPLTIPSHYDVFDLADEEQFDATKDLEKILAKNLDHNVHVLGIGQFLLLPESSK
ncbi:MAG: MBL fold metallo-hydrolase [Rickettsia sp.]|nr:MBL fold metallo-hydrolase [Rickettsia sp.]